MKDDGTLFLTRTGRNLEINGLGAIMHKNAKLAGIPKRTTALTMRHSIASALLENGMDVRSIQEFLHHVKLSTTQVYASVTLTALKREFRSHHPREKRARPIS